MSSAEARNPAPHLRRLPILPQWHQSLQPHSLMGALSEKHRLLLVRDGHPNLSGRTAESLNMRLEDMEGRKMDSQTCRNMDAIDQGPHPDDLSKRISHHHWLRQQNTPLYTGLPPTAEVKSGFFNFLLPYYANVSATRVASDIVELVSDANNGHPEQLLRRLSSFCRIQLRPHSTPTWNGTTKTSSTPCAS